MLQNLVCDVTPSDQRIKTTASLISGYALCKGISFLFVVLMITPMSEHYFSSLYDFLFGENLS